MIEIWWHENIGFDLTPIFQFALIFASMALTIHILLRKSDPKASLMWIALVWFAPIFGAVFYFLFGINRISKRASRLIYLDDTESAQPDDLDGCDFTDDPWAQFRRLGNRVTQSRGSSGNSVKILEGVDLIHRAMIDAIGDAHNSVELSTYIFRRDALGASIVEALILAHHRGVDVKVLLDGVGNGPFRSKTYRQLKSNGIAVHRFLHSIWPWRMPLMNMRNHRKLLIVDGDIAFTGSMNLGGVSNLETQFKIRGPVVYQCRTAFNYDWQLAGGREISQDIQRLDHNNAGDSVARAILSGPIYERERLRWVILGALGAASKTIRIVTPYFVPDHGLISGLVIAALKGVRVEIILPERSNYAFADWASQRQLKDLLLAGCHIYHRADIFDHSKLMTVDGQWGLIGSSNWDARSLRLNFELDMEWEDVEFVGALDHLITARRNRSEIITSANFADRSVFIKLRNSAARLLLPYL